MATEKFLSSTARKFAVPPITIESDMGFLLCVDWGELRKNRDVAAKNGQEVPHDGEFATSLKDLYLLNKH
jgi:hypothetical protein